MASSFNTQKIATDLIALIHTGEVDTSLLDFCAHCQNTPDHQLTANEFNWVVELGNKYILQPCAEKTPGSSEWQKASSRQRQDNCYYYSKII